MKMKLSSHAGRIEEISQLHLRILPPVHWLPLVVSQIAVGIGNFLEPNNEQNVT